MNLDSGHDINEKLYDNVPYDSVCFSQTHPSRLAGVARLFGAAGVAPIENARILEVGCAAGGNLLPTAVHYPNARCLGIDLSGRQIDDGNEMVRRLGLGNIELRRDDILNMSEAWGEFDYIIAHGVYSWVPGNVQRHLLSAGARMLSPGGLMFVSYNVNPGWRFRGAIRDLMKYYTARFAEPLEQVRQARALVEFLADAMRHQTDDAFVRLLIDESEHLKTFPDFYVLHEYLEPCNEPLYFHEFAGRVSEAGLSYLGDSRPYTMVAGRLPGDVEKGIRSISRDRIELEQFMDLLSSRVFRESILCRPDLKLDHTVTPERLEGLFFSAAVFPKAEEEDSADPTVGPADWLAERVVGGRVAQDIGTPGVEAKWVTDIGQQVATKDPIGKAVLHSLCAAFPGSLSFDELARNATATLGIELTQAVRERIAGVTLGLIFSSSEAVECLATPHPLVTYPGARPRACPLAMEQSRDSVNSFL